MNEQLFIDLDCEDLMSVMSKLSNNADGFYLPMDSDPVTINSINLFMRKVILDGRVRIGKVVGFGVRTGILDTAPKGYLPGIKEDIFQLTERLSNLIFKPCPEQDKLFTMSGIEKRLSSNDLNQFRMMSFNINYEICNILLPHAIDVNISYGTAFDHQIQLSKYTSTGSKMVPIHPSYSLSRYVRLMPPRYQEGMLYIPVKKIRDIALEELLNHITETIVQSDSNTIIISYKIWDIFDDVLKRECSRYYKKAVAPLRESMRKYLINNTNGQWERLRMSEPAESKTLQDFEFSVFKEVLLGDNIQDIYSKVFTMHYNEAGQEISVAALNSISDVLIKYC